MFVVILQSLLCVAAASSAAVIPSLNLSEYPLTLNVSNTFTDERLIDPRFTMTGVYLPPALNTISYLMNVLDALVDLTFDNFFKGIDPRTYADNNYPGVSITTLATTPGGTIETRFIVWGLYVASSAMIADDDYQGAIYKLKWEGIDVGYLQITNPEAQLRLPQSNNTQHLTQRSCGVPCSNQTKNELEFSQNMTLTDLRDPELVVDIHPKREALTIYELFTSCFIGLLNIAHFPSTQQVEPFELQPGPPYGTTVSIGGAGPDFRNPEFEYRHAAIALALVAHYELRRGRFREVLLEMSIEISGRLSKVGQGYISKLGG